MDKKSKNHSEEEQLDLFNDFKEARVFTSIFGSFIGNFNKDDFEKPVNRLSKYMSSRQEAEEALENENWEPPEYQ